MTKSTALQSHPQSLCRQAQSRWANPSKSSKGRVHSEAVCAPERPVENWSTREPPKSLIEDLALKTAPVPSPVPHAIDNTLCHT